VALRATGGQAGRLAGGFRFTMRTASVVSGAIALRDWARARLAPGRRLIVRLSVSITTGDGVRMRSVKTIRLHV
jgi:hypothetical protein